MSRVDCESVTARHERQHREQIERCDTRVIEVSVLAQDPATGSALGHGAVALAALGDSERAKEWIKRALLMDPDNFTMRWNLTCALSRFLGDKDGAIDLLATFVDRAPPSFVEYLRLDTDLDPLREDPRFENLAATAEQRVAASRTAAA